MAGHVTGKGLRSIQCGEIRPGNYSTAARLGWIHWIHTYIHYFVCDIHLRGQKTNSSLTRWEITLQWLHTESLHPSKCLAFAQCIGQRTGMSIAKAWFCTRWTMCVWFYRLSLSCWKVQLHEPGLASGQKQLDFHLKLHCTWLTRCYGGFEQCLSKTHITQTAIMFHSGD